MIKIQIIGPYRGETYEDIALNISRASDVAKRLWAAGFGVFCPHLNTAHFSNVTDEDNFLIFCSEMLEFMDAAFVLNGWENSQGSIEEVSEAVRLKKPIIFENGVAKSMEMLWNVLQVQS